VLRDRPHLRPLVPIGLIAAVAVVVLAFAAANAFLHRSPSGTTLPDDGDAGQSESPVPDLPFPRFRHIYVVVLENHSLSSVIGDAQAPYLNDLAKRFGLATSYRAVARPSQPNYIALFSGSTHGVADNDNHDLDARNLADEIEAKGRTWKVFAENVPTGCFTGATADGGADGPGTYARKHEPAISFDSIRTDPARCANIVNLSSFDPAAADFELIVPNLCHDMHDCSVGQGDTFLSTFLPKIIDSPAFADSALFITFDEADSKQADQIVPLIVVGSGVPAGFRSSTEHTHYSLLRSIEDAWGLGCLDESCDANNLGEFFPRTAPSAGGG
jgi:hypothetical protein